LVHVIRLERPIQVDLDELLIFESEFDDRTARHNLSLVIQVWENSEA
jgi:hypothetical protein